MIATIPKGSSIDSQVPGQAAQPLTITGLQGEDEADYSGSAYDSRLRAHSPPGLWGRETKTYFLICKEGTHLRNCLTVSPLIIFIVLLIPRSQVHPGALPESEAPQSLLSSESL